MTLVGLRSTDATAAYLLFQPSKLHLRVESTKENKWTMNRLFWVRHGESETNVKKIFSFKKFDCPLTPKGILQARQTSDYFIGKRIHNLYSSPLKRALETAQIMADRLELDVTIIENFREVNIGEFDGQPMNEDHFAIHERVLNDWFAGRHSTQFPDGENYLTLWSRMQDGLKEIIADRSRLNILVVGHGGGFKYTLKDLCRNGDPLQFRDLEVHNCSISEMIICLQGEKLDAELVSLASTDHLYGPAADFIAGLPEK